MFVPPRCPHADCPQHRSPDHDFFVRKGSYRPKCRSVAVPRFRCRGCGRGFSRQTFRADYHDHRPDLNVPVFSMLCSGVGYRHSARELGITRNNLERKARKLARHLQRLHENLAGQFPAAATFAFDEMETFEGCRSTRTLTVPFLIEQDTFFVVAAKCAPVPPSGKMTPARRRRIAAEALARGRRTNQSRRVCAEVLAFAAARSRGARSIRFRSDKKTTYPGLVRRAFGTERVVHTQVDSKRRRDPSNPLHRINLMLAIARDLIGRLRRRSWLVSKDGKYLDLHLAMFTAYRNYHRSRFNGERESPAELLGFVPRRLRKGELLSWRQDWGRERSIHPLSSGRESIAAFAARMPADRDSVRAI